MSIAGHESLLVTGGVEPVRYTGIGVSDYIAGRSVGIWFGLKPVKTCHMVGVVQRLAPEIAEMKAGVGRLDWDADLDQQRLVGIKIEHSAGVDVGALTAARRQIGPRGSLRPLRGMNVRPSPFRSPCASNTMS